jgi:hypothetical protein
MTITGTIFPNSCRDIERIIIGFPDLDSLGNLSRVSLIANKVISEYILNQRFKEYFAHLYPSIFGKCEFPELRYCHPKSFWKMMCYFFSNNVFPQFKASFIEGDRQMYCECLKARKSLLEKKLEEICPVRDEAKKDSLQMNEELHDLDLLDSQLKELLFSTGIDSEQKLLEMINWFTLHGDALFLHSDEEIKNMPDEEWGELNRLWISKYRSSMQVIQQTSELYKICIAATIKYDQRFRHYQSLESEVLMLQSEVEKLDLQILDPDSYVKHIEREWKSIKQGCGLPTSDQCQKATYPL